MKRLLALLTALLTLPLWGIQTLVVPVNGQVTTVNESGEVSWGSGEHSHMYEEDLKFKWMTPIYMVFDPIAPNKFIARNYRNNESCEEKGHRGFISRTIHLSTNNWNASKKYRVTVTQKANLHSACDLAFGKENRGMSLLRLSTPDYAIDNSDKREMPESVLGWKEVQNLAQLDFEPNQHPPKLVISSQFYGREIHLAPLEIQIVQYGSPIQ